MKSNVNNQWGTAPDRGLFTGPILGPIPPEDRSKIHPGLDNANLTNGKSIVTENAQTIDSDDNRAYYGRRFSQLEDTAVHHRNMRRQSGSYWLDNVPHGQMPLAPSNYTFFRNIKTDYGAVGDGHTDDTAAINRAITDGQRCGSDCGSTTVLGALIYFPPGQLAQH